jgi:hypothetical protein
MDPPGRFLQCGEEEGGYFEADVQRIIDKTLQALRERKWLDQSSIVKDETTTEKARSSKPGPNQKMDDRLASRKGPSIGLRAAESESVKDQDLPEGDDIYNKSINQKVAIWSKISVYWPLDKTFYAARILDRQKFDVLLQYEDDDLIEWVDLTRHTFRLKH